MQVAKRAVSKCPSIVTRSVDFLRGLLQSLKQLTDPPLDLDIVFQRQSLFRTNPAVFGGAADWMRAHLQITDEKLKALLERNPQVLTLSQVSSAPFLIPLKSFLTISCKTGISMS